MITIPAPYKSKPTAFMNQLYNKYAADREGEHLTGNFHDLLWQLIVNEVHASKLICFYVDIHSSGLRLTIVHANEYGHQPTAAYFVKGISHDEAMAVCYDLNLDLFGLDRDTVDSIVFSSMSKREQPAKPAPEGLKEFLTAFNQELKQGAKTSSGWGNTYYVLWGDGGKHVGQIIDEYISQL